MDDDLDLMTTRVEARQARLKLARKLKKTVIKQELAEETETKDKTEEAIDTVATIKTEPQKTTVDSKLTVKGQRGQ